MPALVAGRRAAWSPSSLDGPSWLLAGLVALPVAALLAWDRTRSLGHALVVGHLVARSGSVVRRRRILEVDHVIGWNLRATWFQRRAGLTTLVATMAGGNQAVRCSTYPRTRRSASPTRRCRTWSASSGASRPESPNFGDSPANRPRGA